MRCRLAGHCSGLGYHPFGMLMPGRKYSASDLYRYGFNGKENDNDVKGEGNQQDYGMRIYDPRLGKFLSVDPLTKDYPWYTPYQFAGNKPIEAIDLDGEEEVYANQVAAMRLDDVRAQQAKQAMREAELRYFREPEVIRLNPYTGVAEIGRESSVEARISNSRFTYNRALGESISGGIFGSVGYIAAGDQGAFAGASVDQAAAAGVALRNPSSVSVRYVPVKQQATTAQSPASRASSTRPIASPNPSTTIAVRANQPLSMVWLNPNAALQSVPRIPRRVGNLAGGPLQNGIQVSGSFPLEGGQINSTIYRADNRGNITSYATYDANGMIIKRVDVIGTPHNNINTPHVIDYGRNSLPDGSIRVQTPRTDPRPARPDEIP